MPDPIPTPPVPQPTQEQIDAYQNWWMKRGGKPTTNAQDAAAFVAAVRAACLPAQPDATLNQTQERADCACGELRRLAGELVDAVAKMERVHENPCSSAMTCIDSRLATYEPRRRLGAHLSPSGTGGESTNVHQRAPLSTSSIDADARRLIHTLYLAIEDLWIEWDRNPYWQVSHKQRALRVALDSLPDEFTLNYSPATPPASPPGGTHICKDGKVRNYPEVACSMGCAMALLSPPGAAAAAGTPDCPRCGKPCGRWGPRDPWRCGNPKCGQHPGHAKPGVTATASTATTYQGSATNLDTNRAGVTLPCVKCGKPCTGDTGIGRPVCMADGCGGASAPPPAPPKADAPAAAAGEPEFDAARLMAEIRGNLANIPQKYRVNAAEGDCASLAVSIVRMAYALASPASPPAAATAAPERVGFTLEEIDRLQARWEESEPASEMQTRITIKLSDTRNVLRNAAARVTPASPTPAAEREWREECEVLETGCPTGLWYVVWRNNEQDWQRLTPDGWTTGIGYIDGTTGRGYFPTERAARDALARAGRPGGEA